MSPGMGSEEDDRGSPFSPSTSASRPRLVIKEMVLRNFKSYAGEQRIGPFHKVRLLFFLFSLERGKGKTWSRLCNCFWGKSILFPLQGLGWI